MATPVAKLHLDTRSWGPPYCDKCDADVEDALLMSDGSIVCDECKTTVEGMEEISKYFTSASPIKQGTSKVGRKKWVIEWESVDSSRDITNAYDSQEEALEVAADWAKEAAKGELEQFEWDKDDEEPGDLKAIIAAEEKGNHLEAVKLWLDYQGDHDPDEKMSIGPSGSVSDSSGDLDYVTR